jgi:hypothetical protein
LARFVSDPADKDQPSKNPMEQTNHWGIPEVSRQTGRPQSQEFPMKLTRNLVAILAIASFTSAFASDNRLAARYPKASAYNTKAVSTPDKPPKPATNVQCPVMGGTVDANSSTVTVEGNQYRVCCSDCGDKIKADPRHFLNSNGTFAGAWENNSNVNHL